MDEPSVTIDDLIEAEAQEARLHGMLRFAGVEDAPEPTGDAATDWAVALMVVAAAEHELNRPDSGAELTRWHGVPLDELWRQAKSLRTSDQLTAYGLVLATIAGRLYEEGRMRRGDSCLTVAEGIARRTGELRVALYVTWARAGRSLAHQDFATAIERYRLVLKAMRRLDEHRPCGEVLLSMGDCALRMEDELEAETLWSEAMLVFDEYDDLTGQALILERLATLEERRGLANKGLGLTELAALRWATAGEGEQAARCEERARGLRHGIA